MKRKTISILLFLMLFTSSFITLSSPLIADDSINGAGITFYNTYNSEYENITPSYQAIPLVNKKSINAGEKFSISFQISGSGKIEANKLLIFFPQNFLKEEPTYKTYVAKGTDIITNETGVIWYDENPTIFENKSKLGICITSVNATFENCYPTSEMIYGERSIYGHRPIKIIAKTGDNIPAGDYIVKFNFVYTDGEKWYHSSDEAMIHIRDWNEQYGNFLLGSIAVPFATTLSGALIAFVIALHFHRKKQEGGTKQPSK